MSAVHAKSLAFLIHEELFHIPKCTSHRQRTWMHDSQKKISGEQKNMKVLLKRNKIIQTRKDIFKCLYIFFSYQIGKGF